jgi:hypothetical protein
MTKYLAYRKSDRAWLVSQTDWDTGIPVITGIRWQQGAGAYCGEGRCLIVGDQAEDKDAAKVGGMGFEWSVDYFGA